MATRVEWTKAGLKVTCETSKRPMPRTKFASPIPDLGTDASALITATPELDAKGFPGIRVATIEPAGLSASYAWRLLHRVVPNSGTATTAQPIPLGSGPLSIRIGAPQADATHYFSLERTTTRGRVDVLPETSCIVSGTHALVRADAGNLMERCLSQLVLANPHTDNLIPNPNCELGALPGIEGALVVADAVNAFSGAYVRRLDLSGTNTTDLTTRIPCLPGDRFYLEGRMKVSNVAGAIVLALTFFNSAGAQVGKTTVATSQDATYPSAAKGGVATAPSGAVWVKAQVETGTTQAGAMGYLDGPQLRRLIPQAVAGGVIKFTSGTSTWTVPEGVYRAKVTLVGGGGGGAGATNTVKGGGGGGAGGVAVYEQDLTPGDVLTVTAGAPGSAGALGSGGGTGGNSTLYRGTSQLALAGGGWGGYASGVGGAGGGVVVQGSPDAVGKDGGALGTAGGSVPYPYQSIRYGTNYPGTGGGGGGSSSTYGGSGGITGLVPGGGPGYEGGGGGGASALERGGNGGTSSAPNGSSGTDGSGGGGGHKTGGAGGAGGAGWVKIEF